MIGDHMKQPGARGEEQGQHFDEHLIVIEQSVSCNSTIGVEHYTSAYIITKNAQTWKGRKRQNSCCFLQKAQMLRLIDACQTVVKRL
jgi:hypothetical protein